MPEHQNTEYKQIWKDEYLKWVCGFANAQGGNIYIGIDDKGNITGLTNYKNLLEEIPNKITTHLGLVADVNLKKKTGKHYIEISVQPSEVAISYHGVYYYRTGSIKHELKGTALQEFLLRKMGRSWDDMPLDSASIKDINEKAIKRFIETALQQKRISSDAANDGMTTLLENLHLLNEKGKIKCAAILLFGKDPLKYFTHAYFKIGRFGTSDSDLKFQDTIEGNIFEMPDKVIDILRSKYLTSPISYEGLQRKEVLEYPEEALREAILNSIVHKNYASTTIQLSVYDDRLILWNPGTLPPELSIDALKTKHASYPRNKNIAAIFFKAGYIETWGRGTNKIIEACKAAGLPEPIIEELQGGIQITFRKDIYTKEALEKLGLTTRQIQAVMFAKHKGRITNKDFQNFFSVSRNTASNELRRLVELKLLVPSEAKGAGSYFTIR